MGKTISQLPEVTTPTVAALFEIEQAGASGRITAANLFAQLADALLTPGEGVEVRTNVDTKQALYTVPLHRKCIPTKIIVGEPSLSLATLGDALSFGFDATAENYQNFLSQGAMNLLTNPTKAIGTSFIAPFGNGQEIVIGSAGEVFGCRFYDVAITATLRCWLFGFLY
jgi:hypothetical protein